jgi:hypothetical protein
MPGEVLDVQVKIVFPVSGCTETEVSTGGNGGSVMQSVWEKAFTDNKLTIRMII